MEKTHIDEHDILLRFKNSKSNRGCREFYKLINQINLGLEKLIDWYNKYKIYKII